jgi:hypothetical protein
MANKKWKSTQWHKRTHKPLNTRQLTPQKHSPNRFKIMTKNKYIKNYISPEHQSEHPVDFITTFSGITSHFSRVPKTYVGRPFIGPHEHHGSWQILSKFGIDTHRVNFILSSIRPSVLPTNEYFCTSHPTAMKFGVYMTHRKLLRVRFEPHRSIRVTNNKH